MENFSPAKRVTSGALSANEKIIILNVHDALRCQHPAISVDDIVGLCSAMTGISKSTIYKLMRERKNLGQVLHPLPSPGRCPMKLDDEMRNSVRSKVHSFYLRKEIPTIDKILLAVNEDKHLPQMSRRTLWKLLRNLKFTWEKINRRSVLIEKQEIIIWRRNYLREIRKYRREGRRIFYLDETWINAGHTVQKTWHDNTITSARQGFIEGLSSGFRPPSGKGKRLIITHIGNEDGFIDGGLLEFESKKTGDYHEDMTADVFEEYFEQMLDLIPQGSIIVMDNASYHSRRCENLPTTAWRKAEIIDWLSVKNITFEDDMVKRELLDIVKVYRNKYIRHVIDEMAKNRGIEVLRLPPYHCELNPIELVWAQVKGDVARNNTTFKLNDVKKLMENALNKVTPERWKNCVSHVLKEEDKFWQLDNLVDITLDPIVISVNTQDSDSDSEMEISDEEES